jgi:hypothetical protein
VVAAAVLVILAVTGAFGTHHDQLSALSHGTSSGGAGPGSSGGTASARPPGGPGGPGAPGSSGSPRSPGSPAGATTSAAGGVSPSAVAGGTAPAGGPSPAPSARPSSHGPSPSHSPSPGRSPSPPASSTTAPPPPPPPGTLQVAPRTIVVSALSGASLTLTASGGPVSWSVTESSGLIGQLSVTPSSGRLLAGQSTTVSVNVTGGLLGLAVPRTGGGVCVGCQLTINPGGIVVSVVIEVDVTPSSPPPSTKPPS